MRVKAFKYLGTIIKVDHVTTEYNLFVANKTYRFKKKFT
jgi:hypothetical protein